MTEEEMRLAAENYIYDMISPDFMDSCDYFCDLETDEVRAIVDLIYKANVEVSW